MHSTRDTGNVYFIDSSRPERCNTATSTSDTAAEREQTTSVTLDTASAATDNNLSLNSMREITNSSIWSRINKKKRWLNVAIIFLFICGGICFVVFKDESPARNWKVTSSADSVQPTTSIWRTDVEVCRIMGNQFNQSEPSRSAKRAFVEKVILRAVATNPEFNIQFGLSKTIGLGQKMFDNYVSEIMEILEVVFESAKHGYNIDPRYFKSHQSMHFVTIQITPGQPMIDDFTKHYFILAAMKWDDFDEPAHRQCLDFIRRQLYPEIRPNV